MARIVVIGGTGYAGGHIVAEAVRRGHEVVAFSRSAPDAPLAGAHYVQGSVLDVDAVRALVDGADVVISSLSPRGDMSDLAVEALAGVVTALTGTSTRLGVVGGAGGSLSAPGGPRLYDLDFPEEYKHEAKAGIDALALLEASDPSLDWFFVHPAEVFGPWAEGERTGHYRIGDDGVVVRDAEGTSTISGADFALAMIDEVERAAHHRARFTVGY